MLSDNEIRKCFTKFISIVIVNKSIDYKRRYYKSLEKNEIIKKNLIEEYLSKSNLNLFEEYEKVDYKELEKVFTDLKFHNAMKPLSSRYKQVLYFFVIRNFNIKEISLKMGISEVNVRKIKQLAIKKFLENLEKEG